jgi:type II secretory pathway component PulF
MLALRLHKRLLVVSVLSSVVVSFLVVAKKQRLPNKIDSVRAAIEALVSWIKVVKLASYCRDCSVVVASVIKYKVA